jgi:hypothetical protein
MPTQATPQSVARFCKRAEASYARPMLAQDRQRADREAPLGCNWRQVDTCRRIGLRSLPSGSSLAQLFAEQRGYRNLSALPRLTVAQILRWADASHCLTREWPLIESGPAPEARHGDTWRLINLALREGLRGLRTRCALAQQLTWRRGVRKLPWTPPPRRGVPIHKGRLRRNSPPKRFAAAATRDCCRQSGRAMGKWLRPGSPTPSHVR